MPNNGDNERKIRDMLGLVKFCLETTAKEDAQGSSDVSQPMDPDRRAWLQNAINSMTVDTTRQLLEKLALVKETVYQLEKNPNNQNIPVQKTCTAIEVLTDLCEEIDYACDFVKLDGFSIFKPLIGCTHEEMIVKACELIAALAQNNPVCQTMAMNTRLLERLLDFVDLKDQHSHIKARSFALYAISSIIRSNQEVRIFFESTLDGLAVLLRLLDYQQFDQPSSTKSANTHQQVPPKNSEESKGTLVYWWRKLRIRSVFLFRTLCSESETASNYFFEKRAIKKLENQLENPHDPEVCEHLLNAVKAFLLSLEPEKQSEALSTSPNLSIIVQNIHTSSLHESHDQYDMTDTRSTCKELLDLIRTVQSKN